MFRSRMGDKYIDAILAIRLHSPASPSSSFSSNPSDHFQVPTISIVAYPALILIMFKLRHHRSQRPSLALRHN